MTTKEKIITQALERFNELGINAVGVRDIAISMGISPGNMSYHFPKKEDLITELASRLRAANDAAFQDFLANTINLTNFLFLMQRIFNNQYQYRALFLGMIEIQNTQETVRNAYKKTEQPRKTFYRDSFQKLVEQQELQTTEEDLHFLVSFMSLAGRFWLSEAAISFRDAPKEAIIHYYLHLISKQLSLFATPKGKEVLANLEWADFEK